MIKSNKAVIVLVIELIVPLALYFTLFFPRDLFVRLTVEDGFVENLGALFLLSATISYFLLFLKARFIKAHHQEKFQMRSWRVFFLLLAMIHFFGFGEEISWGQRIFEWETPEYFTEHNMQKETNIHNLKYFHLWTDDNERRTGFLTLFTAKHLFIEAFFLFLFVLPLAYRYSSFFRKILDRLHFPVPHSRFGWYFILNLLTYQVLKRIIVDDTLVRWGVGEIQESVFTYILFLVPFYWLDLHRLVRRKTDTKPISL